MKNGDKGAFARPFSESVSAEYSHKDGLTKREYLAGLAMQGLLANPSVYKPLEENQYISTERVAILAVLSADELLKELEK